MVSPVKITKPSTDGIVTFNFNVNSSNVVAYSPPVSGFINNINTQNIASWEIKSGVYTVTNNTNPNSFNTSGTDTFSITITKSDTTRPALFEFLFTPNPISLNTNLYDYSNKGGDGRYLYLLSALNLYCVDTSLLNTSNMRAITAITNNGSSLTLTCNSHGLSNGKVISLIDADGYSSAISFKPFTVSNVTTNTFDITITVTGTWNGIGYLAGSFVTTPIISTTTMPNQAGNTTWRTLTYRDKDKSIYAWSEYDGTRTTGVSIISADSTSPDFNIVKDWTKTTNNTQSYLWISSPYSCSSIYDPVNDAFYHMGSQSGANFGTYYVKAATALNRTVINNSYLSNCRSFYIYNDGTMYFDSPNGQYVKLAFNNNKIITMGIAIGSGFGIYSYKSARIYVKENTTWVSRYYANSNYNRETFVVSSNNWQGIGCAVNALDKVYIFRMTGTPSYGTTTDLMVWDEVLNTNASCEYNYIPTWGTATTIYKAQYSYYSGLVLAVDNGGLLHIFDTTRAANKKYLGNLPMSVAINDIQINNLAWL